MILKKLPFIQELCKLGDHENRAITFDANDNPISYVFDDCWNFKFSRKFSKSQESRSVSFKDIPAEYKRNIQLALMKIIEENPNIALETLKYERGNLVRIAKLSQTSDWSVLNDDFSFRVFKSNLKNKKYSKSTVVGVLVTLNKLFKFGLTTRIIDNIALEGYELACETKKQKAQHIAIPEDMAIKIFRAAEKIVNEYYPHRTIISNAFKVYYENRKAYLERNPNFDSKQYWGTEGYKVSEQIEINDFEVRPRSSVLESIKASCMILIFGYSGVRHGEGVSIGLDSYKEKQYNGFSIPYIEGTITKTNENGIPKKEAWITHPIVKNAIELLFDITDFSRQIFSELYSDDKDKMEVLQNGLISTEIIFHKENVLLSTTTLNASYNKFLRSNSILATEKDVVEFNKLNPTRSNELKVGGYLPKLSSHDFRRTFAVFLIRNKLGSLMALKYQYKHLNIIMTQWYANNAELVSALDFIADEDLQALIKEANIFVMTEAAFDIFNSPTLSGGEGEKIAEQRIKNKYSGKLYVSKEELERQVRTGELSLVEHPTGYCFNPSCDRICSSEISSITCKHEAVTRDKALERLSKHKRLVIKFNHLLKLDNSYSSIRNRIYIDLKAIEFVLNHHKINFHPFEEPTSYKLKD